MSFVVECPNCPKTQKNLFSTFLTFINTAPKLKIAQKSYLYFKKLELLTVLTIYIAFFYYSHKPSSLNFKNVRIFAHPFFIFNDLLASQVLRQLGHFTTLLLNFT